MSSTSDSRVATVADWYAAYDARDVDALCKLAHPDIEIEPVSPLLTKMPGTVFHGLSGLRSLMTWSYETYPHVRVKSNTVREVSDSVVAAASFGSDDGSELAGTTETHMVFELEGGLIRRVRAFASEAAALAETERSTTLTAREREIFQLLAQGLKAPEIADRLRLSPATVRTHVQNGIGRLGAHTRIQAVSMAIERGEIRP
jgi:DNA-binding NarL/FixJ family response regulator